MALTIALGGASAVRRSFLCVAAVPLWCSNSFPRSAAPPSRIVLPSQSPARRRSCGIAGVTSSMPCSSRVGASHRRIRSAGGNAAGGPADSPRVARQMMFGLPGAAGYLFWTPATAVSSFDPGALRRNPLGPFVFAAADLVR